MVVLSSPVALFQSIPPVTRTFTLATVLASGFYGWLCWKGFVVEASQYMTLVPGSAIFQPWTFLTSVFVETTVFEFIASLLFVPLSLKYLERLWGSIEIIKFIVVSVGFSNLIAFGFNWIEFVATRNADLFLYGMRYHGQMSLQIAILVAFTQLIPEHQIQILGVFKARVKTLPMAYLTLSTVLCMVGLQCPWIVIQFGWFVGWIYLRFYKKNTSDTFGGAVTYGDRSETFSLISWFPPLLHKPLTILGNFVFSWANHLHLIPSSGGDIEIGNSYNQLPGGARAEAERRRALALKALDQRLANSTSSVASSSHPPRPAPGPAPSSSLDKPKNSVDGSTDSSQGADSR